MILDKFYQENKDCNWTLEEIPKDLTTDVERAKWIFSQPIGWIELDLEFDIPSWLVESKQAEPFLVHHREGDNHSGWKSCCIHGLGIEKTGTNFTAPTSAYQWTALSEKTPVITNFWKQFPFEKLLRVRFMNLDAGGHISRHNDCPSNDMHLMEHIVPINIAIDHPENCYMTLQDYGVVPWKTGKIILVNITNDHAVFNNSIRRRMHMIGHGYIGNKINEFSHLIVRSYNKQYERNRV